MPPQSRKATAPADEPEREERAADTSTGTAYLNVSGSPITYDRAGHQVAAGEWTPQIHLDAIGQAARRAEHLLPPSAL